MFATRDRANLQLVNRKLERKVKELMIQVDDEHTALQDQKDQVRHSQTAAPHFSEGSASVPL